MRLVSLSQVMRSVGVWEHTWQYGFRLKQRGLVKPPIARYPNLFDADTEVPWLRVWFKLVHLVTGSEDWIGPQDDSGNARQLLRIGRELRERHVPLHGPVLYVYERGGLLWYEQGQPHLGTHLLRTYDAIMAVPVETAGQLGVFRPAGAMV